MLDPGDFVHGAWAEEELVKVWEGSRGYGLGVDVVVFIVVAVRMVVVVVVLMVVGVGCHIVGIVYWMFRL